jgi:hypothetical protein
MSDRVPNALSTDDIQRISEEMSKIDWFNPDERRAVAETITKQLRENLGQDDIIAAMGVDVQTFREGQVVEFVTTKGAKAYVHAPGTDAVRSELVNKTVQLRTELVSVAPQIEIGQLQSGRYGGLVEIRRQAEAEFKATRYATIWTTLINSISSSDSNYWSVASTADASSKLAALISGFDYVADQPYSDVVAIVGRRGALSFLSEHSAYGTSGPSEEMKTQIDTRKRIETFRGVPVIHLRQHKDVYGTNLIQDNEIIILGEGTIKMGIDRPLNSIEHLDPSSLMWTLHMYEKYGVAVVNPDRNARIHIA